MARGFGEAQPVVMALPDSGVERRRLAAWLGLLSEDLERALSEAPSGIPLAPPAPRVVSEAAAGELQALGIPAEVLPQKTALERICGISTRTFLLGAVSCALGNVVVDGLGGMITAVPEPMLLYGLVVPTALAFGVSVVSLPVSLTTGAVALSRRQAGRRARAVSTSDVDALAERGVEGRAAQLDAAARALCRRVIRTQLPEAIEQDALLAIEDCRRALRRVDSAPEGLLDSIAAELASLGEVLERHLTEASTARDVSSPLANIRRTVAALRSSGG